MRFAGQNKRKCYYAERPTPADARDLASASVSGLHRSTGSRTTRNDRGNDPLLSYSSRSENDEALVKNLRDRFRSARMSQPDS